MRKLLAKLLCKIYGHIYNCDLIIDLKQRWAPGIELITGIEDYCERKGCDYSCIRKYDSDNYHPRSRRKRR
jgi:hypothetical protein